MASITLDDALILPHRTNQAPDGVFGKDGFGSQLERLPIYVYVISELIDDPREDGLLEVAEGANIIAPHVEPNKRCHSQRLSDWKALRGRIGT